MSTNDGEIAVRWAIEGHGIILRAEWDVARHVAAGRLRQILSRYRTYPADIYAAYPARHQYAGRVIAFVDLLQQAFHRQGPGRIVAARRPAVPGTPSGQYRRTRGGSATEPAAAEAFASPPKRSPPPQPEPLKPRLPQPRSCMAASS